ncbi:beta-1,3-galactosyltransferase brn-like [Ostrea edulis]|uniref:beta-1,3-galactosyltransferase brn-like n=1 Tax=Ostrea edulis TaxID=37623 RepID=UPI0024AE9248|nr:beta-1,3-galactosyltransferase brn-like [Ostrea edulis]
MCKTSSKVLLLLVLVKSKAGNFRKRRYIRDTWGKDARKRGYKVAFLLGYSKLDKVFVDYENEFYGDVIQQDFRESYHNNTHKIKMAFDWVVNYCKRAQYIIIVDDDMYLNIQNAVGYISQAGVGEDRYLYSGYFLQEPLPDRYVKSKHYISEEQYPFDCYPPYIAGACIFLNQHAVQGFYGVLPYIPYFPFDDVFIGFLAQILRIKPLSNNLIKLEGTPLHIDEINEIKCIISQHGYNVDSMFYIAYNSTHSQFSAVENS